VTTERAAAEGAGALPLAVQRTQLELLLRKTGAFRLLSAIPFASVLALAFYARWGSRLALAWLGLMAVASISSHLRRRALQRRGAIPDADIPLTLRRQERDVVLLGAMWGLAPWMLDPHGDLAYLLLTMVFVVATIALGSMLAVTHRQTIPAALGLMTACAWFGGVMGWMLAIGTGLFLLMVLNWIRQQAQALEESLVVRFEKEELASRLEAADREKTRFFAAASHDLRQPLHAVSLFTAALERTRLDAEGARILAQLAHSVDALSRSLDTMLDVSRLDAGSVQPRVARVGVHGLLRSLLNNFAGRAEAKGLQLRVRPPGGIAVHSDPLLLERLLGNLVDNAIKYTQVGGVVVAARVGAASGRPGYVRFDIVDTGIGIPPEHRQRVFEEFFQLGNPQRDRRAGLGLGLSIVRRLSELLAHPVALAARHGGGTRFQVWVPLAQEDATSTEAAPGSAGVSPHPQLPARVLVVDDEGDSRDALATLLASHGCTVRAAGDLEQAQALLEAQAPEAVIADYRLPGERSGLDFLLALRARSPRTQVLLVTGETAPHRIAAIEDSGVPCLIKPVRAHDLLQALQRRDPARAPSLPSQLRG
jgi:signal transduction histidine kinase/ActR/RegA family two-component response regulator